ncbi:MAG: hypothetical protein PHH11_08805 [Methylomonas sp.]|nr:hypothetical protein [Methylomonas sp.]
MPKKILFLLFVVWTLPLKLEAKSVDDNHIRQIVTDMLREKDQKIEQLEARIRQLEQEKGLAPVAAAALNGQGKILAEDLPQPKPTADVTTKTAASDSDDSSMSGKLRALDKKVAELKASTEAHGLNIGGFFDINAKTGNSSDQTFSIGSVELDLDYAYDEHFGASSALLFNGNSDPTAAGGADIAVALVDYHSFDDRIPPRGRIFNNQGWHIQGGRFDLPFGTDYQYYASKDRVTVSAPLTTTRIQNGGYNSDGIRAYGSWNMIHYSAFWTNGVYGGDGSTIGGRLGLSLAQNPYTVHRNTRGAIIDGIEFGVSHLSELDGDNDIRNTVYGADLSIGYGMWRLQNEFMLLQAHRQVYLDADDNIVSAPTEYPFGKNHQLGYHTTLIADLDNLIKQPVQVFARYGRWQPSQKLASDYDGTTVAINDVSMLSIGLNYKFSDYLRIKFEYDDTLGTHTAERYFDKRLGITQIVMSF